MKTLQELDLQPGDVVGCHDTSNLFDIVLISEQTTHKARKWCSVGDMVALERDGTDYQQVKTSSLAQWWVESRAVRNETAEADRPLEPHAIIHECLTNKDWGHGIEESALSPELRSEGTHIHAALLAQDDEGVCLQLPPMTAEQMEELRVLGQRTGGLIEFNPGKRKPMDSAGDLIRNYPDLASDLAADDEFAARFLNALADRVHATNVKAGWWTDLQTGQSSLHTRNVPEMLMLIVSEISEALEAVRKNLMDDKLPHRPGLTVELADAVIRILDLAGSRMAIEQQNHDLVCRNEYIAGRPDVPADDYCHPFGTVLIEKMDFNANREDHKIENRRGPNGKRI